MQRTRWRRGSFSSSQDVVRSRLSVEHGPSSCGAMDSSNKRSCQYSLEDRNLCINPTWPQQVRHHISFSIAIGTFSNESNDISKLCTTYDNRIQNMATYVSIRYCWVSESRSTHFEKMTADLGTRLHCSLLSAVDATSEESYTVRQLCTRTSNRIQNIGM